MRSVNLFCMSMCIEIQNKMHAYVVSRPSKSYNNQTTTCIRFSENQIHTIEKYKKIYSFKKNEQICESSPTFYNDTLKRHIKHVLTTITNTHISKDVITIVGFGTSGSGKTFNLLGMDSSGLHNKYSVLCGIIQDIKDTSKTNVTIEVTQVYKNQMFVIQPARKIAVNQVFNTFKDCLGCWKQEQFSTHNSSRAHLLIKLIFNGLEIRIIDTAGFETPDEERKHVETVAINQDMLAFKECIRAVAEKQSFIPSRRRTITRLLFEHKTMKNIKNHVFVIGAIDPNCDSHEMKNIITRTNPKHPKLSIIHNTLNYLTMLGCASAITSRRPITSRPHIQKIKSKVELKKNVAINDKQKVSNKIIERLNTIEPKFDTYVPERPLKPNSAGKPRMRLNREKDLVVKHCEIKIENTNKENKDIDIKKERKVDPHGIIQDVIDNRSTDYPSPVSRYITNQVRLMTSLKKLNYKKDSVEILNMLNDQQLLAITMQMVVLEHCELK